MWRDEEQPNDAHKLMSSCLPMKVHTCKYPVADRGSMQHARQQILASVHS